MKLVRTAVLSFLSLVVMLSTFASANEPPVALPRNGSVYIGGTMTLDGSLSSDPDGDLLSYSWVLIQKPAGSAAVILDEHAWSPTFVADQLGLYFVELVVSDGSLSSAPVQARIEAVEKRLSIVVRSPLLAVGESVQGHVAVPFVTGEVIPPVTVTVISSDPSVAAISPGTVFIKGGGGGGASPTSESLNITGLATGTVTLSATAPGYLPSTEAIVVQTPGTIHISDVAVGNGLYVKATAFLIPNPTLSVSVTLEVSDPRVALSSLNQEMGSGKISVNQFGDFFVQARRGTGKVQVKASAPGYATHFFNVTVLPSGIAFILPNDFVTNTSSPNRKLHIAPVMLHPTTGEILDVQSISPESSGFNFPVKSSNPKVGVVYPNLIRFRVGDPFEEVDFDPEGPGITIISLPGVTNRQHEIKIIVFP